MSILNQDNRLIHIDTPMGKDAFIATQILGEESISGLFRYELELFSDNHAVGQKDLVGKSVTVTLFGDENSKPRYIHAYVVQLAMLDVGEDGLRCYRAQLVPGLWFSNLASNNRIFHKKSAKTIISEVLSDYSKVVTLSVKLAASYIEREYCVQFGETDFEFVSRLMSEEGICYYFKHSKGKHELVVADDSQDFFDCTDGEVEYLGAGSSPDKSAIHSWMRNYSFHTGGFEFKDYNEFTPTKDNKQEAKTKSKLNDVAAYKNRHFGNYEFALDKENTHKLVDNFNKAVGARAMESQEAGFDVAEGSSDCASFCAGGRFGLTHSLASESAKYLITQLTTSVTDGNSRETRFNNTFSCVPASVLPRPDPMAFSRPQLQSQLATVIEVRATASDSSKDAFTQVKVKFAWNSAQNTSWIRVVQSFAGKDWGANFVPRVGQEVVIGYINGDPDRPIVTGAVYNGTNKGPNYTATQSGWKTEYDGSKFNELRFDDNKGKEEIYMEAGRDHNFVVHNDQLGKVENDQTLEVKNNRSITIIDGDETKTLSKGSQTVKLSSGDQTLKVAKGKQTVDVMGAIKITSKTSIELKVGGSSIKLTPSGIVIKGVTLSCKGDATAEVKAGAALTLKGGITLIN